MADGELGFLGLTHNPFVAESSDFFEGGDRKTHLEQVRHLGQWTRHVILVTGPLGVGKTTLYRQLSMTLEPRVKAARLNGVLVNTSRDVLSSIAQGLGATVSADANVQTIAQALATYIIGQDRQGRFCLVMVDDAQLLDLQSLEELLKLTRTSPAYVCLFGEPGLVSSIAKPAARNELSWHEIRLAGLSLPDIEKYRTWKLSLAQYRGRLPFSPTQLNRLAKLSGGLPAAINHVGAELIERLESGNTGGSGVQFPIAHGLIVVLLVVVVSLAYLVLNGSEDDVPDSSKISVSQIELPGTTHAAEESTDAVIEEESPAPEFSSTQSSEPVEPTELLSTVTEVLPGPLPPLDPVVTEEAVSSGVGKTADSVARAEPAAQTIKAPSIDTATLAAPVQQPRIPSGAHDAAWLKLQSGSGYTIQLVSLSTEERLVAYLAQQQDRSQFAWYPIERGGKRLYVVTYGNFDSKAAAEAAAASLPSGAGKVEPWVRPIKLVQDAIAAGT